MVRRCTFLQGLFIHRPGYLTIMVAKRSESWSPRRLLSLAVNHASWYSHPWAVLSLNLNQSHDWKKTQKVTLCDFQGGIGHFKETLHLYLDLLRFFCSEPSSHAVRSPKHMKRPHAGTPVHSQLQAPAMWEGQHGAPAWLGLQMTPPALASMRPQQHAVLPRGAQSTTEPSKTVKCHFHLRMS